MQLELTHAYTVPAVGEQVKTLQQANTFPQLQILILQVLVAFFEVSNQMLLPSRLIFYLQTKIQPK